VLPEQDAALVGNNWIAKFRYNVLFMAIMSNKNSSWLVRSS
jgi:hypothetical protein